MKGGNSVRDVGVYRSYAWVLAASLTPAAFAGGPPPALIATPDKFLFSQSQDEITVQPLTLSNPETENLSYVVEEGTINCGPSADLTWVSASVTEGVVPALGNQVVELTFDTTGFAPGPLSGALCFRDPSTSALLERVSLFLTVVGTPEIEVAPLSLMAQVGPGEFEILQLVLQNTGTDTLNLAFSVAATDCAEPSVLGWVVPAIEGGQLSAMSGESPLGVIFNSQGLAPGEYTGLFCIASNDPLNPLIAIPVTLGVTAPAAQEIPTLSDLGLAAMVLSLLVLGWVHLRRR